MPSRYSRAENSFSLSHPPTLLLLFLPLLSGCIPIQRTSLSLSLSAKGRSIDPSLICDCPVKRRSAMSLNSREEAYMLDQSLKLLLQLLLLRRDDGECFAKRTARGKKFCSSCNRSPAEDDRAIYARHLPVTRLLLCPYKSLRDMHCLSLPLGVPAF